MKRENRIAIVTEGVDGIGRAITRSLAKEGADVVVADIDIERANEVADEIMALDRKVMTMEVDVTESEETKRMAAATVDKFGAIDILINCAVGPAPVRSFFHESEEEVWDRVIVLNLKGVRNCTRAVINHMIDRRSGKIINIASIVGLIGTAGIVDY